MHGNRTGTSGEATRRDRDIRGAVALDWNSGEETALDRSGQGWKKRRKRRRQDAARRTCTRARNGGDRGHEEQESGRGRRRRRRGSGQTHGNRTGTSGEEVHTDWNMRVAEALDWNVRGRSGPGLERLGLQKEEDMATERSCEENMHKSKARWRRRTRRTIIRKREEKEKKGKRKNTWKPDWNIRGRSAHGLEHPGGGGPGLEHPGKKRPGIGVSGAAKGGGSNGGTKRQGEHE